MNPSKLKMPSTPDIEFLPEFTTVEKDDNPIGKAIHPIFKHQPTPILPPPTPETPESRKVRFNDLFCKILLHRHNIL